MAGFDNDIMYANNADFSVAGGGSASAANGLQTNGQLWIGATTLNAGGTHINVGNLTSPDSSITFGFSSPNITAIANSAKTGQTITGDTGGALSPTAGNWNILGSGSITTSGTGSTLTAQLTGLTNHNVLIGAGTSTITKVAPGASGTVLTSNGPAADPSFQAISSFNPSTTLSLFDDFNAAITNDMTGTLGWRNTTWAIGSAAGDNNHPGVVGNGAVGAINIPVFCILSSTGTSGTITLGGGTLTIEYLFNIRTLSNGTIRYTFRMGFGVTTSTADQTDGVYIEYSDNVNSGNWQYKTAQASTRTTNNSSIAVTTGWHKLVITVNANASSISFTMDGVSMGSAITTNIPSASIAPLFYMNGTVGNLTSDMIGVDYMKLDQTFTTPR